MIHIYESLDTELSKFVSTIEPFSRSVLQGEEWPSSLGYQKLQTISFVPQHMFSSHYAYMGELMSEITSIDDMLRNLYPSDAAKYALYRLCHIIIVQLPLRNYDDVPSPKLLVEPNHEFPSAMSMHAFEQIWQGVKTLLHILEQPAHQQTIPASTEFRSFISSIEEQDRLHFKTHPMDKERSRQRILQLEKVLIELDMIFSKE